MPLTVRAWPDSTDPRGPLFGVDGFAWGMVPAERYLLTTVGALAPFLDLNAGVLVIFDTHPDAETWTFKDATGDYVLTLRSNSIPFDVPPVSARTTLTITRAPEPVYTGFINQLFPPAIELRVITVAPPAPPPDKIPNPVTSTPRNHLFTL